MNATVILAASVAIGVLSHVATAKPVTGKPYVVLWDQEGNSGAGVNSQNYEAEMAQYDDAAADDFMVPTGQRWYISEVDVTGTYVKGSGQALSVVVAFYHNRTGIPFRIAGRNHGDYFTISCTDNSGSFQCVLPTGKHGKPLVTFRAGTWWVSVIANCDSQTCGVWNWMESTTVTGNQSVWENPGGAWKITACHGWRGLNTCFGGAPADLAFKLIGTSKPDAAD